MWVLLVAATLAWAESKSEAPKEIPFDPEKIIYKTKSPKLGPFEIVCAQRLLVPNREIIISFLVNEKKVKTKHELLHFNTYNSCDSYKFKLSSDLKLTMTSAPGERTDEPGAKVTAIYAWNKNLQNFENVGKTVYSPFKELQAQYRKILATAAIPKAEKLVLANRKKIEAYHEIDPKQTKTVCEDFFNAYKVYGDNLYKEKDYKQAFDIYLSLKVKFGAPQNLFYNNGNKNDKIVLVCQDENSNADQSEDQFYIFAKRYLNKVEFVPFMLQRFYRNMKENTESSKELATQILKFLSYLLKTAPKGYQLEYQKKLIDAWNTLVKDNSEHPFFNRLLDEDGHFLFLLAENKNCTAVPKDVINRIPQKDDDPSVLKGMTLIAGDEAYDEGLEKAAIFEYKQFVASRVLLKKCGDIPKKVFERYFKFIKTEPYSAE
jgi:hypothetical protein